MNFSLSLFSPSSNASQFTITPTSVRTADLELTVPIMFNRESVPSITFRMTATDQGTPNRRSDFVDICITITVSTVANHDNYYTTINRTVTIILQYSLIPTVQLYTKMLRLILLELYCLQCRPLIMILV